LKPLKGKSLAIGKEKFHVFAETTMLS